MTTQKKTVKMEKKIQGKVFRWVVSDLPVQKDKEVYKKGLLDRLLGSPFWKKKTSKFYKLAIETHASGRWHVDLLFTFNIHTKISPTALDFLCEKHGDLTKYSKVNSAILAYGDKEDVPLTNMSKEDEGTLAMEYLLKTDPISYFLPIVREDPWGFDFDNYVSQHEIARFIKNYGTVRLICQRDAVSVINARYEKKVGIAFIDRALVESSLTEQELKIYDSWSGYQTIVDALNFNTIVFTDPRYLDSTYKKPRRPIKSFNLLITGPANVGKTSLFDPWSPESNTLRTYCSVYGMSKEWFPSYKSFVYQLVYWDEMTFTGHSYPLLLQFLGGSICDLPVKGSNVLRFDNPLLIGSSNLTLYELIDAKFYRKKDREMAYHNMEARVKNVVIPEGYTLFLLQKLFHPRG